MWPWKRKDRCLPPSSSSPPSPLISSSLHRRLCVQWDKKGLILRPALEAHNRHKLYVGPVVRIRWADASVEQVETWAEGDTTPKPLLCEGIAGLLAGFQHSFLIVIAEASVAATLFDPNKVIYSVESLLSIPIDSSSAKSLLAKLVVKQLSKAKKRPQSSSESGDEDEDDSSTTEGGEETDRDADLSMSMLSEAASDIPEADSGAHNFLPVLDPYATLTRNNSGRSIYRKSPSTLSSSVANATRFPSTGSDSPTSSLIETTAAAVTASESLAKVVAEASVIRERNQPNPETVLAQTELDEKIVKGVLRELKGMYFSPSINITHSMQSKHALGEAGPRSAFVEPLLNIPMWRRADKRFWWNAHLMAPFVEAGLHSYIVVLQQGFIHQTTVPLPLNSNLTSSRGSTLNPSTRETIDLDLIIISRRSVERPGLRYQRRGVNDQGGVANFVETEFIVGATRDSTLHVSSFVQTRGSIPIFWSQSPWALKPPPMLERTSAESLVALTKHFEKQLKVYGRQIIVNLAECTGKEALVVNAYQEGVEAMNKPVEVKYVYFDFHHECRGMKYENISKLITTLQPDLDDIATFWATEDEIYSSQSGVLRVNCIDCLDRTNVVQSAIARYVLNRHLVHLGVSTQEETGMHDQLDVAFNGLWADNGDAISHEYAGTSALKGDFTRTGKRNIRGALNDASNSVARLLQSTVSDFFKQATIDFVLGNNLNVFSEFQARLETSDPGEILRLAQIRLEAIETSFKSVLSEGEERVAGWTLLSPEPQDVVKAVKYEEKVLLLSNKAVYVISYEYTLQKVTSFVRIPSGDILGIKKGPYILSALNSTSRDPVENYGFVLSFHAGSTTERIRTYSLRVRKSRPANRPTSAVRSVSASSASSTAESFDSLPLPDLPPPFGKDEEGLKEDVHFFAFKALRPDMVRVGLESNSHIVDRGQDSKNRTARATVDKILERLTEECEKVGVAVEENWIVEEDIASLADAEAETSLFQKLGHRLQTLIWLA